jgi:hypothetical protein
MKERPILFKGEMVRAILSGAKTQTRRVMKVHPCWVNGEIGNPCPYGQVGDRLWVRESFQPFFDDECDGDGRLANWKTGENYHCSYPATDGIHEFVDQEDNLRSTVKPSIHMPRWASRVTLEITSIRVERLKDISDNDAIAEGIYTKLQKEDTAHGDMWMGTRIDGSEVVLMPGAPRLDYRDLWESINGAGSWDANPWVWVVEFRRAEVAT